MKFVIPAALFVIGLVLQTGPTLQAQNPSQPTLAEAEQFINAGRSSPERTQA